MNLLEECHTQTRLSGFVPVECIVKLRLRLAAKDDGKVHFRALARALALTNSQATTASGLWMLSANRRRSSIS